MDNEELYNLIKSMFEELKMDSTSIKLTLENDINRSLNLLSENYIDMNNHIEKIENDIDKIGNNIEDIKKSVSILNAITIKE